MLKIKMVSPIVDRYMGLGYAQEAFEKFQSLKDKCEKVGLRVYV